MVASSKTRVASAVKLTAAWPSSSVTMPLYVVHTVPSTSDSSTRKLATTSPHSVSSISAFSAHICVAAGAFAIATMEPTVVAEAAEVVVEDTVTVASGAVSEEVTEGAENGSLVEAWMEVAKEAGGEAVETAVDEVVGSGTTVDVAAEDVEDDATESTDSIDEFGVE